MMGHGRPSHSRRSRAADGESAVTPVIGAILILAITVLGIAGVLYWGAPMIDRIQAQNAQVAVVGEFNDLRDASSVLSVPDHSRFPTIVIPRGDLSLERGSRIMVTVDRDAPTKLGCDFHVTGWADTTAPTQVSVSAANCRTPIASGTPGATEALLQIFQVSGATIVQQTITGCCATPTVAGADFSSGDWLFRLANTACPSGICAEAWLHSGDRVSWDVAASSGQRGVSYENGAIFSETDGTLFLEREATVGDSVFGSSYFGLWLRSLSASTYGGITGAGSHQVYLSLLGNYDRVESSAVSRLRFDASGDLSEGWCRAFLARNTGLADGSYQSSEVAECGFGPGTSERSVCYTLLSSASCTSTPTTAFTFRFLHARIYTSLSI
ncbi:MAG: hypothetical protein ACYC2H_07580 [Thermoplasmatota archaeon]